MKLCMACELESHEICSNGKEDCECSCQAKIKNREFSAEQERIIEASIAEGGELDG